MDPVLLSLISHQPDIDKNYLHAKDSNKVKYQLLIKKWESVGLNPTQKSNTEYWSYLMIYFLICLVTKNLIQ